MCFCVKFHFNASNTHLKKFTFKCPKYFFLFLLSLSGIISLFQKEIFSFFLKLTFLGSFFLTHREKNSFHLQVIFSATDWLLLFQETSFQVEIHGKTESLFFRKATRRSNGKKRRDIEKLLIEVFSRKYLYTVFAPLSYY